MRYSFLIRVLALVSAALVAACSGGGGGSNSPAAPIPVTGAGGGSNTLTAQVYPATYQSFWQCSGSCGQPAVPYPFGPIAVNPVGNTFYFLDWNYLTVELNQGAWKAFVTKSFSYGGAPVAGIAFTAYDAMGTLYAVGASPTTSYLISHADATAGQTFTPIADDVHDIQASSLTGRVLLASGINGVQVVDNAGAKGTVKTAALPAFNCAFRIIEGANHDVDASSCGYYDHLYRFTSALRLAASVDVPDATHINEIAPDPDGGVWFADDESNRYGKMSATGALREYSPPAGYQVSAVATTSDGRIWLSVSDSNTGYLAQTDESGHLTMHALPAPLVQAEYLRGSYNSPGLLPNHIYFLDKYGNIGSIVTP